MNSFIDCQSDKFGVEFVKAFVEKAQNWFFAQKAQSTSKYKSVHIYQPKWKVLSEVAISKTNQIISRQLLPMSTQLPSEKIYCKLVVGFNDQNNGRWKESFAIIVGWMADKIQSVEAHVFQ